MAKELEDLPNGLTALQPMTLNHLKDRIKLLALKYPFSVHPECCSNSNCITAVDAC